MHRALRTALISSLAIGLVAPVAAGAQTFNRKAAIAAAAQYDGVIGRDRWGVPRVHGTRDADAAFALGYAFAEDDFALVQEALVAGNGHRLTARDEAEARVAYLVQLFRIPETADRAWASEIDPKTKAYLDGYAAGVNLWAARNPKQITRPGLFPLSGRDIVRNGLFTTPLFYGMSGTLTRLVAPDAERKLDAGQGLQVRINSPGKRVADLLSDAPLMGSNAFVVGPRHSGDGATRLIANSHQPLEGPLAWLEASVSSDEGLNMTGGAFPASPMILLGANPTLAYAATVNRPDLIDTYKLVINPANANQYRLDGVWRDFEVGEARMRVRVKGLVTVTVKRPTRWSAHGPVLDTKEGPVAIRWASMNDARGLDTTFKMMRARSVAEARALLAEQHQPSTYRLYADSTGQIARYYLAKMPMRIDGPDWKGMLPGDESKLIWNDFESFDALPHVENPPEGWLTEANSTPFKQMGSATDPDPKNYPKRFGIETDMTNRAWRASKLMRAMPTVGRDQLWAIKMDAGYDPASFASLARAQLLAAEWLKQPRYAQAAQLIRDWDLTLKPDSKSAALAMLTLQPIGQALFLKQKPPEPRAAFDAAIAFLTKHYGRIDVPWLTVNELQRGDRRQQVTGGPDVLRAVNSIPNDKTGTLKAVAGDGLIILAEWDANGKPTLSTVSPFGASGRPGSPHYTDQMAMFAAGERKVVPVDVAERRAWLVRQYRPQDLPVTR